MSDGSIFCGYCSGFLGDKPLPWGGIGSPCPRCRVWMHASCWEESEGKCPRYGCGYVRAEPKSKPEGQPVLPRSADVCRECGKQFFIESESFSPVTVGGVVTRKLVHICKKSWDDDAQETSDSGQAVIFEDAQRGEAEEEEEEQDSQKLWVPPPLPHSDAIFSAAEDTRRTCKTRKTRILVLAAVTIFVIAVTYNMILAIGEDPPGKIHCDTCVCQPVGQEF